MILANACPRCHGALSRVMDIDEMYYSCVHCGHIVYGSLPAASDRSESRWQGRQPADRAAVRRRMIARERRAARRRVA